MATQRLGRDLAAAGDIARGAHFAGGPPHTNRFVLLACLCCCSYNN